MPRRKVVTHIKPFIGRREMRRLVPKQMPYADHLVILALKIFMEQGIHPTRSELWNRALELAEEYGEKLNIAEGLLKRLITEHKLKYWTRKFIETGLIAIVETGRPQRLSLTKLGEWISDAPTCEEFTRRYEFAAFNVCRQCCSDRDLLYGLKIVLLAPNMSTAFVSRRGILNATAICPICNYANFVNIHYIPSLEAFTVFYNKAIKELKKYFKHVHAQPVKL